MYKSKSCYLDETSQKKNNLRHQVRQQQREEEE